MLNKKDLQIIANLRNDARMNLTTMSRATGIPVSTIFDRIKSYKDKIITKNSALIDFEKLGYNTRAKIMFKVNREDISAFKAYMMIHENINSIYRINNGYDFMMETIFKNIKDMEAFLDEVQDRFRVEAVDYYYIIDDLKREAFMSDTQIIAI